MTRQMARRYLELPVVRGAARAAITGFTASRGLVALTLLLGACSVPSASPPGTDAAADELRLAATATLAQDSFHVEVENASLSGRDAMWEIDYNAPDRARFEYGSLGTIIVVGSDVYTSVASRPGFFYRQPDENQSPAVTGMFPLGLLEDVTDVNRTADTFRFQHAGSSSASGAASGEATVSDGLVVAVTVTLASPDGSTQTQRYTFSQFGSAAVVAPPPSDRILPQPACASSATGIDVCVSSSGSPAP